MSRISILTATLILAIGVSSSIAIKPSTLVRTVSAESSERSCGGKKCSNGRFCVQTSSGLKCRRYSFAGQNCGSSEYPPCYKNLMCQENICKIPEKNRCDRPNAKCVSGTSCVGPDSRKKCKKLMPVGGKCGTDPYWVCETGLLCENHVCKITSRGPCNGLTSMCANGLKCVGPDEKEKCKELMPPGGKCETDPYWFCEDGLVCEDNVCKIPSKGPCDGADENCADGLKCVGPAGKQRCKMLMRPGGKCKTDPYWVCEDGLVCEGNVCKIPPRGPCDGMSSMCATGLKCVGPDGNEQCKELMPPGGKCETDPYWFCEEGLVCEGNVCKIPSKGSCEGTDENCADGLKCVGPEGKQRCKMLMPPGGKCETDPYWFCEDGLVCEDNVCKIPSKGPCDGTGENCADGLKCVGPEGKQRCKMLMPLGGKCKIDPYWVCEDGLICEDNVCVSPMY